MKPLRSHRDATAHAARIVAELAKVFSDLATDPVASIAREHITAQLLAPTPTFEFLLTTSGSWRLKNNHEIPGTFRVADYRLLSDTPREPVEALNAYLATFPH